LPWIISSEKKKNPEEKILTFPEIYMEMDNAPFRKASINILAYA
jgi:hypothetical protein